MSKIKKAQNSPKSTNGITQRQEDIKKDSKEEMGQRKDNQQPESEQMNTRNAFLLPRAFFG